tara:strand:+ start:1198 stop:1878 length:681 start_codon:yes stop_codon:yes gene_type:complete
MDSVKKSNIITTNDGSHSVYNSRIQESYHSKHGAIVEAEHVFIRNGLLAEKNKKLNILEIGFGTGLNALLTSHHSKNKMIHVNYHAIELYPINKELYNTLNFTEMIGIDKAELLRLHQSKWGKKNIIHKYFSLIKNKIDLRVYTTNIKFDIIFFDAFSPEKQPELWDIKIFKNMYSILKDDGFLITYCAKGVVKRTMQKAGFKITVLDGPPGKRQMTRANKNIIQI